MAFSLTARINAEFNSSQINSQIVLLRKQLESANLSVNVKLSKGFAKNLQRFAAGSGKLNTQLKKINRTLGVFEKRLDGVAKSSSFAATNIDKFNASLTTLQGTIANNANLTVKANASVKNLGQSAAQSATGVKKTTAAVKDADSALFQFGRTAGLAFRRAAGFTIFAGSVFSVGVALRSGVKRAIEFEQSMIKVAQVTRTSIKSLSGLRDEIFRLATGLGVSSQSLAEASVTLSQSGLTADETRKSLEALAKTDLAATFGDIKDTTEGAIAIMAQFGIKAEELTKAFGSINAVSAQFAVESSDIISAIKRAGGVFAATSEGVSSGTDALNEFIAVFTSVRATTRESAETIATGLRTIFTRIQRPSTIAFLRQVGIELQDAEGKFVGPLRAVEELGNKLSNLSQRDPRIAKIVEELGGFRQVGKVIPLLTQAETRTKAYAAARDGANSLDRDAEKAQEALGNRLVKVREKFTELIDKLTRTDTFKALAGSALTLAESLISLTDALKNVLPLIVAAGSISVFKGLGKALPGAKLGLMTRGAKDGGFIDNAPQKIQKFAAGGLIRKGGTNADNVLAMVGRNEYILPADTVQKIGVNRLEALRGNNATVVKTSELPGFQHGGVIDPDEQFFRDRDEYLRQQRIGRTREQVFRDSLRGHVVEPSNDGGRLSAINQRQQDAQQRRIQQEQGYGYTPVWEGYSDQFVPGQQNPARSEAKQNVDSAKIMQQGLEAMNNTTTHIRRAGETFESISRAGKKLTQSTIRANKRQDDYVEAVRDLSIRVPKETQRFQESFRKGQIQQRLGRDIGGTDVIDRTAHTARRGTGQGGFGAGRMARARVGLRNAGRSVGRMFTPSAPPVVHGSGIFGPGTGPPIGSSGGGGGGGGGGGSPPGGGMVPVGGRRRGGLRGGGGMAGVGAVLVGSQLADTDNSTQAAVGGALQGGGTAALLGAGPKGIITAAALYAVHLKISKDIENNLKDAANAVKQGFQSLENATKSGDIQKIEEAFNEASKRLSMQTRVEADSESGGMIRSAFSTGTKFKQFFTGKPDMRPDSALSGRSDAGQNLNIKSSAFRDNLFDFSVLGDKRTRGNLLKQIGIGTAAGVGAKLGGGALLGGAGVGATGLKALGFKVATSGVTTASGGIGSLVGSLFNPEDVVTAEQSQRSAERIQSRLLDLGQERREAARPLGQLAEEKLNQFLQRADLDVLSQTGEERLRQETFLENESARQEAMPYRDRALALADGDLIDPSSVNTFSKEFDKLTNSLGDRGIVELVRSLGSPEQAARIADAEQRGTEVDTARVILRDMFGSGEVMQARSNSVKVERAMAKAMMESQRAMERFRDKLDILQASFERAGNAAISFNQNQELLTDGFFSQTDQRNVFGNTKAFGLGEIIDEAEKVRSFLGPAGNEFADAIIGVKQLETELPDFISQLGQDLLTIDQDKLDDAGPRLIEKKLSQFDLVPESMKAQLQAELNRAFESRGNQAGTELAAFDTTGAITAITGQTNQVAQKLIDGMNQNLAQLEQSMKQWVDLQQDANQKLDTVSQNRIAAENRLKQARGEPLTLGDQLRGFDRGIMDLGERAGVAGGGVNTNAETLEARLNELDQQRDTLFAASQGNFEARDTLARAGIDPNDQKAIAMELALIKEQDQAAMQALDEIANSNKAIQLLEAESVKLNKSMESAIAGSSSVNRGTAQDFQDTKLGVQIAERALADPTGFGRDIQNNPQALALMDKGFQFMEGQAVDKEQFARERQRVDEQGAFSMRMGILGGLSTRADPHAARRARDANVNALDKEQGQQLKAGGTIADRSQRTADQFGRNAINRHDAVREAQANPQAMAQAFVEDVGKVAASLEKVNIPETIEIKMAEMRVEITGAEQFQMMEGKLGELIQKKIASELGRYINSIDGSLNPTGLN